MSEDHPFHTQTIDGTEYVGLLAHAGTERIYEFVDPDIHTDYVRGRDPRDGEVLRHDTIINYAVAQHRGMLPMTPVPAEDWADVCEAYADGEWTDVREFIGDVLADLEDTAEEVSA